MQAAIKLNTKVLPGHRIEVTAPELPENSEVELIIVLPEKTDTQADNSPNYISALDLIESLPPGPRSAPTWEEVERNFQQERDSWDH